MKEMKRNTFWHQIEKSSIKDFNVRVTSRINTQCLKSLVIIFFSISSLIHDKTTKKYKNPYWNC